MAHTAGPWMAVLADDPRGQPVPYYRGIVAIVSCAPGEHMTVVTAAGRIVRREEWAANAKLLAAAPDMLAAARLRFSKGHNDTCSLVLCPDDCRCDCGHDALGEALELVDP